MNMNHVINMYMHTNRVKTAQEMTQLLSFWGCTPHLHFGGLWPSSRSPLYSWTIPGTSIPRQPDFACQTLKIYNATLHTVQVVHPALCQTGKWSSLVSLLSNQNTQRKRDPKIGRKQNKKKMHFKIQHNNFSHKCRLSIPLWPAALMEHFDWGKQLCRLHSYNALQINTSVIRGRRYSSCGWPTTQCAYRLSVQHVIERTSAFLSARHVIKYGTSSGKCTTIPVIEPATHRTLCTFLHNRNSEYAHLQTTPVVNKAPSLQVFCASLSYNDNIW